MRLKTVTITGADDTVDPLDLFKLSSRSFMARGPRRKTRAARRKAASPS